MFGNPRQVRKRSTSSSGLTPGSSLRNTLSTIVSSNTTDEFDCSTPIRRTAVSADSRGSAPSNWWKLKCPSAVVISSLVSIRRSNSIACVGSASASYTVHSALCAIDSPRGAPSESGERRASGSW